MVLLRPFNRAKTLGTPMFRRFVVAIIVMITVPVRASAQLRPLEPMDWQALTMRDALRASLRIGWFTDQRASLAGVRGDLFEVGELRVMYRVGRVAFEAAGTPQRFMRHE